jgi:aminobenzoyl-glutamate utilization protein B
MKFAYLLAAAAASALAAPYAHAADADHQAITGLVEKREASLTTLARSVWEYAEVGYKEERSSALLANELKKAGFSVTSGIAGMPTAFKASFKRGDGPVIAILAEFDALPGLAQDARPERAPIAGQAAGHACGHNLFGAASVTAAIAIKEWMAANDIKGELRVYGTPAEEGGSGKVYMVRAGLFDDVAATLHWHPSDTNGVSIGSSQANISGKFRFRGVASHASAAPDKGRSALDGVEIMNVATNYLREHVPIGTRIHYVVTNGGQAPNVVPDFAESYYYVRSTNVDVVRSVWGRVVKAGEGAALATETKVEPEITGGVYAMLGNEALAAVMHRNLVEVGGPRWTDADRAWAEQIQPGLPTRKPLTSVSEIGAIGSDPTGGSTDVADVSWASPTIGLTVATWVPGTPAHSWQAVAASGAPIGARGALVAAKTLALSAADLFRQPEVLKAARAEFDKKRGPDFRYQALVGDRAPPLDYRDKSDGNE